MNRSYTEGLSHIPSKEASGFTDLSVVHKYASSRMGAKLAIHQRTSDKAVNG
jgi:hypothetical protein